LRVAIPTLKISFSSRGGATPEGQMKVLRGWGITPETIGAPIYASMEVQEIVGLITTYPSMSIG